MPSFDAVSELDFQEVSNALDQARREIETRYDFRDTNTVIEYKEKEKTLILNTSTAEKVEAAVDILQSKLIKRGVPLRNLDYGKIEPAGGQRVRQTIKLLEGIDQDKAKAIVKKIKDSGSKVQASIQGDCVRVTGKKRDDLQEIIALLKANDFGVSLQYKNFRD
jgi:uncharacterized protein YajQ (UPF0234 family)